MSGEHNSEQLKPDIAIDSPAQDSHTITNAASTSDRRRKAVDSAEKTAVSDSTESSTKTDKGIAEVISESENISPQTTVNETPLNNLPFNMAETLSLAQMRSIIENAMNQSYVLSSQGFTLPFSGFDTPNPDTPEIPGAPNTPDIPDAASQNTLETPTPDNLSTPAVPNPPLNGQYFTYNAENPDAYRYTFIPHTPNSDPMTYALHNSAPGTSHPPSVPTMGVPQEFSVDDLRMVATRKAPPQAGWRKGIYLLSGATINLGPSSKEKYQKTLRSVITKPLDKNYQISVLSMKGGVGKTTISFILGSVLATMRDDHVIAVDANPDFGTLAHRTDIHNEGNVRDLINDHRIIERSDISTYTNTTKTGLEILNSEMGNSESDGLTLNEYRNVMQKLGPFYRMVLTDCGTGIHHPSVQGSLEAAHVVIIPTVPSIDSARSTIATMDWLEKKGYGALLKNSIILINSLRFGSANVDIEQLRAQFEPRVRVVHKIPYDPHIAEGGLLDLTQLHKSTLKAFIELAALVVENFF